MKGKLTETDSGFEIRFLDPDKSHDIMYCGESLPLHPDNVEEIKEFRIDYPEAYTISLDVDFEIVEKYIEPPASIHSNRGDFKKFAKIINKEEERTGWDEIYDEWHNENYPIFGGPFTDAIPFNEWLKIYYNIPTRKKI